MEITARLEESSLAHSLDEMTEGGREAEQRGKTEERRRGKESRDQIRSDEQRERRENAINKSVSTQVLVKKKKIILKRTK